jgi:hypothetical protein
MTKNSLLICIANAILLIIGCAPMRAGNAPERNFLFNTSVQIDNACMEKDEFDACLFFKNPVYHRGEVFTDKVGSQSDLTEWQTAGVQLPTGDHLENMNVSVSSVTHPRTAKKDGQWKYTYSGTDSSNFEQVFAYYWTSYATKLIEDKTGHYWGKGKQIKVYLDDVYSGYSPTTNSIHVRQSSTEESLPLNAGILIYYVGLANLYHAGSGQIEDFSADKEHRDCAPAGEPAHKNFCCRSANGCSKAIASGAAEYFAATTFPQAPTVGQAWVNRLEGMKICGQSRNLKENGDVSLSGAFSACAGKSMEGHPVALGTVYASMWWEIREKAKENFANGESEIDQLYQQHLVKVDGADNFSTVYQKIILTDRDLFGGKYAGYFREEFRRRGVNID